MTNTLMTFSRMTGQLTGPNGEANDGSTHEPNDKLLEGQIIKNKGYDPFTA